MITSQETAAGANAAEGEALVSTATAVRRKTARQALSDRASRGLSLMSGFKSRQEKGDGSGKPGGHERSPVGRKGTTQGLLPAAAATASDSLQAAGASDVGAAGRSGSEEDFGPATGGCGHLTKLVLKFTTASESDVQPSCEITTAGATIGQSDENTVSIPSDSMLAPLNHAIVKYEHARRAPSNSSDGAPEGPAAAAKEGGLDAAEAVVVEGGGAADQGSSSSSRSKEGSSTPTPGSGVGANGGGGCHFSAGLTVFRVHRRRPSPPSPQRQDEEGNGNDNPSAVVDTAESESRPGAGAEGREATVCAPDGGGGLDARGDAGVERVGGGDGSGDGDASLGDDTVSGSAGARMQSTVETPTASASASASAAAAEASTLAGAARAPPEARRITTTAAAAAATTRTSTTNEPPCLWLEAVAGCLKGQTWSVETGGATLGRASDNKLSLADKEMSRRHSKIEYDEALQEFYLCDLGSLNGTYMQMVGPYLPRRRLGLGDHLLIGRTGFSVNRFDYGISERMGARPTMEDRSIVIQDLGLSGLAGTALWPQTFAAVYDGHGGGQASEYLWGNLHLKVTASLASRAKRLLAAAAAAETVLCRGGKLKMASADHKPCRPDEQERVQRAGGFVAHRRVMGELAVSRAFGDSEFKGGGPAAGNSGRGVGGASASREGGPQRDDAATEERETAYAQLITAEPEFLVSEITPQDEFLVLACDGIFDVLTSEEVVSNVYEKMKIHADAQRCCEDLTEKAIVERRTRDNVSLVLVVFNKWF
eukprot:g5879.t1